MDPEKDGRGNGVTGLLLALLLALPMASLRSQLSFRAPQVRYGFCYAPPMLVLPNSDFCHRAILSALRGITGVNIVLYP